LGEKFVPVSEEMRRKLFWKLRIATWRWDFMKDDTIILKISENWAEGSEIGQMECQLLIAQVPCIWRFTPQF
jgi:hypothetical protein